ncbi:ATP-dependent RecD-like DNA helicase [Clostridium sp. ZBS18]|uniref:ATP-dependent DNA helicase n=1 Tax=Clostridium sp. ZBS18 TaxID=2949967 RepID=UPI002079513B|nr:ATP-dependent RecD-like DNA helicase [Clostridium sp. ZBS18]
MEEENNVIIKCSINISKILYPKDSIVEDGDFAILSAKVTNVEEGEPCLSKWGTISLKGKMCELNLSEEYNIIAKEISDDKWGKQYEVMFIGSKIDLSDKGQQKIYLSKILTETQVDNLFKTFDNPIEILDKGDVEKLCTVKGIKEDKANKILKKYQNTKDYYKAYVELDRYGLTKTAIDKLVDLYGSPDTTVNKIQENPYLLIDEVDGIGWSKADNMALKGGLGEYSLFRVQAYIKYYLKQEAMEGNTWSYIDDLCGAIDNVIGYDLPQNILIKALQTLENNNLLWVNTQRDIIALKKYYDLENNIAKNIVRLSKADNTFEFANWKEKVHNLENKQGWKFTDEQFNGIKKILENQIIIVTGSAGTGKTATVSGMLEAFGDEYSFAQTALSGRASGNLTDVTGEEGFTIHRLLGVDPETGRFIYNKNHQLDTNIIILDELSMVGAEIFYSLIQAIKDGAKLVMLGDLKQLEAIGIGNIMKDMIESGVVTVVELTKIHRQAQASGIITESIKSSEGVQLFDKNFNGEIIVGDLQDMHFDIYNKKETTSKAMIQHFKDLLSKGINKDDIQLIVPVKDSGKASSYYLSNEVQKILINSSQSGMIVGKNSKTPRTLYVGDKIINMKNNYKTKTIDGNECPIFNGDLGIITDINKSKYTITVKFNNKGEVIIPKKHMSEIWLGYAITTHKMQGSSAPYVICGLDYSHYKLLTRETVYTMLTRAKKYCILCAENKAVNVAIRTSGVKRKQTFLCNILKIS